MHRSDETAMIAEALALDRLEKGVSQTQVGLDLGVISQSISKWEAGLALPRDHRLKQLADYFGPDSATARAVEYIFEARFKRLEGRTRALSKALREGASEGHWREPNSAHWQMRDDLAPSDKSVANTAARMAGEYFDKIPDREQGYYATRLLKAVAAMDSATTLLSEVFREIKARAAEFDAEKKPNTDD